jgi:cytochrome c oxidase subunit 2
MKSRWTVQRWALWVGVGALLLLSLPGRAWAQGGAQSGSLNATDINGLFGIVLLLAILVFFLVEGLLVFAIIRYRRRSNDEMPEQVHGNNRMELGWTLGSAALVLVLFFFTLGFYQQPRGLPANSEPLSVQVMGHTWYWEFFYPDSGVRLVSTTDTFRVPAGRPVVLEITSADVQHSFWIPELAGKVDAIPGRVQRMWFQVDEPRTYVGLCAEYCGREHYNMLIDLEVLAEPEFVAWYGEEAAAVAAAAEVDLQAEAAALTGDPAAGAVLYQDIGCVACHALADVQVVGPSFLGLGTRAAERREGYTADEYLRESILHPCDFVVSGFTCVMPQTYGDQLSPQDLADLVAFLSQQ